MRLHQTTEPLTQIVPPEFLFTVELGRLQNKIDDNANTEESEK